MKCIFKTVGTAIFVCGVLSTASGCSAVTKLEASARADRAANPEKYQEIPEVARQQMSPGQDGGPYPAFCTFGCPDTQPDLSRNW